MTQATVKTVQFLDPRIEPQPDPVYDYVVGPTQNQYYKIPTSGKSNSNLTFNNLTTLGIDRAYLDTFELEISATITFNLSYIDASGAPQTLSENNKALIPAPNEWTFQSWPLNSCCDEARVNINGGSFFSQPMTYIRAKERYMNQRKLSECYENICPCHKPLLQYECPMPTDRLELCPKPSIPNNATFNDVFGTGADAQHPRNRENTISPIEKYFKGVYQSELIDNSPNLVNLWSGFALPSRYGAALNNYMLSESGFDGGFNNSIVKLGAFDSVGKKWANYYRESASKTIVKVTWREPVFCSPFSSKYDATYGRPLYNITSMDLSFNFQDLGNMLRISQLNRTPNQGYVSSYSINIDSANLCYQVMTIPPVLTKPLTTLVPYRRFVPYITDAQQTLGGANNAQNSFAEGGDLDSLQVTNISSGVYTFNEIPTAIWVFVAPTKARYQTNEPDDCPGYFAEGQPDNHWTTGGGSQALAKGLAFNHKGNWSSNKLFAYIRKIEISMANTTQILSTAQPEDLYRIAKANGCQDSFQSWGGVNTVATANTRDILHAGNATENIITPIYPCGAGSVLRLKPGVDLIVPDQPLIPGANANNMVFKADVQCLIPPHSSAQKNYSLWFLFEYVGVAAISPGQCEITMNPLGSGEVMAVSPIMSATSESTEGELEGSGFWERLKRFLGIANQKAKESGIVHQLLKSIDNPYAKTAADAAEKLGYGAPPRKKTCGGSCSAGAVIGKGLNDWV